MRILRIAVLLGTLAPLVDARQQCGSTFTTTFFFNNTGTWTFGGTFQANPFTGGFPTYHLRSEPLHTFAPQLTTTGASIFTGDYRATGASALSVDLQTFAVDFPSSCQRPLSLMLWNDNGTPSNAADDTYVYFVSPDDVPCVDGLWRSYSVAVPSQSTTLPSGWAVDPNSTAAPDAVWNQVITNVSRVVWFYGDPTFVFVFQKWTVGADNPRIAFDGGATTYCISQRNSAHCQPRLEAAGTPSATQVLPYPIDAFDLLNQKTGLLFYGFAKQATPYMGGTMCVLQPLRRTPTSFSGGNIGVNDCSGVISFDLNAWIRSGADPALVPGVTFYAQYWSRDPAAVGTNVNFSNAVCASICP